MEHSTSTKCCTGTLLRQMDAATAAHFPTQLQSGRNLLESAHAMGLDGSCSLANLVCFVDAALAFQLVGMCLIVSKNIGTCYSSSQTSWLSKTTALKSAGYNSYFNMRFMDAILLIMYRLQNSRGMLRKSHAAPHFLPASLCASTKSTNAKSSGTLGFPCDAAFAKTTPSCRLRQGGLSSFGPNAQH